MKRLLPLASIVVVTFLPIPAQARIIAATPVSCWFFRGENLELKPTCSYQSASWAGGGGSSLIWKDGVKTEMAWGIVGRGERVCQSRDEMRVDGVCGKIYDRHPETSRRLTEADRERRVMNNQKSMSCVQVKANSVCWL